MQQRFARKWDVGESPGGCSLKKQAIFEGVAFAMAEELLREAGEMRFEARGEGMLPAIYPGEELVLHRARMRDVRIGDVVLFLQGKRWHVERVREILPGVAQPCLLTRADAGVERREPVFAEDLLGRVAFVVRDGEERVPSRSDSASQRVMRAAVRHVPLAAQGFLAWHQTRERFAHLRHGAAALFAGRVSGSV
jgi:hypothetical protein